MSISQQAKSADKSLKIDFPPVKSAVTGTGINLWIESLDPAKQTLEATVCWFSHHKTIPGVDNGHRFTFKLNLAPDGSQIFVSEKADFPFVIKRDPAKPEYFSAFLVPPNAVPAEERLPNFKVLAAAEEPVPARLAVSA